jgi:hypothetical protein
MDPQISGVPHTSICQRLTAFAFAADPKSQRNESRAALVFAPTNVEDRTRLNVDERALRNTADSATEGFLRKRHPRGLSQLFLLKR